MLKYIFKNNKMLRIVMKIFTTLLPILVFSSLSLSAFTCTELPTTEDISSPEIIHTADAVDIANLEGKDCVGGSINEFKIISLPDASLGILYMADGVTRVTVGQILSIEEANGLKFDPDEDCLGDASFTYASIDFNGRIDDTPATVCLSIIGGGGSCTTEPDSDDLTNVNIINTSGAIDIINLAGSDCAKGDIEKFKIISLPDAGAGILYMSDGTAVTVGQVLTEQEAYDLRFDPADGFVGNATFTYASIDNNNVEDTTPATITLPIIGTGGACTEAPTSNDLNNVNIINTLNAVNIINLAGLDCANGDIEKFKIISLPDAGHGILYMADGVTAVMVDQILTKEEADGLKFDPVDGFVGDATFTYAAIDNNDVEDATPATVTLPVINNNGGGGACTEAPTTDDKRGENLANDLNAVNIVNLSGVDCTGTNVEKFEIKTLPDAAHGTLYMADGVTAVTVGQILTREEADGLRFNPVNGFVGDATFTYASIDANNVTDATPATITIPVVAAGGGGACTEAPSTDDKVNPRLLNNLAAVNILNLSGKNCAGNSVEKFQIKTLPDAAHGILYMADGVTAVTVDQILTKEEADGLKFDPVDGFVGDANFTYCAIDENNVADATPATVTIPLIQNHVGHDADCTCEPYESSVPTNSPFGLILMFLLTLFIVSKSFKAKI